MVFLTQIDPKNAKLKEITIEVVYMIVGEGLKMSKLEECIMI